MATEQPGPFNLGDLTLDVRLTAIVESATKEFTGKNIFSVEFFRNSVGFGITNVEIEVNTSLQPIITITFKDLYGNTVFGKSKNQDPDLANSMQDDTDFSVLFAWPPPKFLFTFKGFLGRSATWMLNMKKSNITYVASDGSYDIKCEFVPNQWGFMADLPFLYLLAVKSLKKQSGMSQQDLSKVQTIFDLIKIGKQVEVKTQEATKEFDNLMKQMTLLRSLRIYDAVFISKVVNYNEQITGQVGNQTIYPFSGVTINEPKGTGNKDIDTSEKIKSLAISADNMTRVNTFLLLTANVGDLEPVKITFDKLASGKMVEALPNIESLKAERIKVLTDNIDNIEQAIKKKVYDSSKTQLEKVTIGEVFKQIAMDSGYIMGSILEAGYRGYKLNPTRNTPEMHKKLIGRSFPLCFNDKDEEKPATANYLGHDVGVEKFEMAFVDNFINAISEGIATELAEDKKAGENVGDNFIKKRICNLEAISPNPYTPSYQGIAENIMIRSGIAAFLIRSSDPNYPGDFDNFTGIKNAGNASDISGLADADFENIESVIGSLPEDEFRLLKRFCVFWDNMLTDDCKNLKKCSESVGKNGELEDGHSLNSTYLSLPGDPIKDVLKFYKVVIDKPASWQPDAITKFNNGDNTTQDGLTYATLNEIMSSVFRPRGNAGTSGSTDTTNSNFIDPDSLVATRVINNSISYFKPKDTLGVKDKYVYAMFDGNDANKTQQVMSCKSDADIKNKTDGFLFSYKEKSKTPLGFLNIQNPKGDNNNLIEAVVGMNERIEDGLMLNYSKLKNPNKDFYDFSKDPTDYFIVNKNLQLADSSSIDDTHIGAKGKTFSIAFEGSSNNELVFGPFAYATQLTKEPLMQRGYIKRICSKLRSKIEGIEQKQNEIISETLGKAADHRDILYKQMHVLYQQWEVLIIRDSDSAIGQGCGSTSGQQGGSTDVGAISNDLANRYSIHKDAPLAEEIEKGVEDNTFIYSYPMNFIAGNENKVNTMHSIINIEPLYKPNGNTTVLNAIQQLCTKNNFMFIPIPGDARAFSIKDIYSPKVYSEPNVKNFFFVQFMPTPESRSMLNNSSKSLLSSSDAKSVMPPAVEIKFGSPENQIFKNIQVDTQESKPTAESIINLQRLVDNENQNKKVTLDCSMLSVMEGRSYRATVDMLGNAQMFPMQFFYLDAIPLFNGLYQILKVKHSIKPNDMSTTVEGIRMRMDFQTGKFGGVQPVTLESLANSTVTLINSSTVNTQQNNPPPVWAPTDIQDLFVIYKDLYANSKFGIDNNVKDGYFFYNIQYGLAGGYLTQFMKDLEQYLKQSVPGFIALKSNGITRELQELVRGGANRSTTSKHGVGLAIDTLITTNDVPNYVGQASNVILANNEKLVSSTRAFISSGKYAGKIGWGGNFKYGNDNITKSCVNEFHHFEIPDSDMAFYFSGIKDKMEKNNLKIPTK